MYRMFQSKATDIYLLFVASPIYNVSLNGFPQNLVQSNMLLLDPYTTTLFLSQLSSFSLSGSILPYSLRSVLFCMVLQHF